jgi:hypothetical protein
MGKGQVHYIEVLSDSDEEEEVEQEQEQDSDIQPPQDEIQSQMQITTGTIAALSGVPRFNTFRVRGVVKGQRLTILVDGGSTHNFIDAAWVKKRRIHTEEFGGFSVEVAGGRVVPCQYRIPKLTVTIGNYSMTDDFFVMDLADTNAVLGVQWLSTLGTITSNYKTMEMGFTAPNGSRVVLKGMANGAPTVVSSHKMEALFRHGDIEYAVECLITTKKDTDDRP